MECKQDGEIVRAKELNTSFTIPKKRKLSESNGGNEVNDDKSKSEIGQKSVVNDAYEQNSNDKPKSYTPWPEPVQSAESYSKLYQYYQQGYGTGDVNGLKVFTLRESPQPKLTTTYKDTFGDLTDATLPKELKEQFQPLFCKLCSMQLGSTVNAKMHYSSKNHEKKVRNFLIEYSKKTGEPLHKKAKKQTEDEGFNPRHYHCDVCDLPLTGRVHAESHYMGKNHQKVLSGKKAPAGKGHYNEEGKFVRDLSVPSTNSTGRDSFGIDFLDKTANTSGTEGVPESAKSLRCDLCNVSVTSYPQMDMHLQGQKHKKKMRANGLLPEVSPVPNEGGTAPPALYTSYRTPSGQYYCKTCNLSLNSESQFSTHLHSKNHSKKANATSRE